MDEGLSDLRSMSKQYWRARASSSAPEITLAGWRTWEEAERHWEHCHAALVDGFPGLLTAFRGHNKRIVFPLGMMLGSFGSAGAHSQCSQLSDVILFFATIRALILCPTREQAASCPLSIHMLVLFQIPPDVIVHAYK